MSEPRERLEGRYRSTLSLHLAAGGEVSLGRAYELGRACVGDGLGILDVVEIHEAAMLAAGLDATARRGAGTFLVEVLAAFEIAFRGYREANSQLRCLNETLMRQSADLAAANEELEAFSYSVSHDLRSPLLAIDGFTRAALEDGGGELSSTVVQHLKRVKKGAKRMATLLDDMLALAQIGRGEIRAVPVDLSALAKDVTTQLAEAAAVAGRPVPTCTIADGMLVSGDEGLLRIAISNLLGNAWKFSAGRPDATVRMGEQEFHGERTFFVEDNGVGFDMGQREQLFRPFRRLHTAAEFKGSGIGLATVQRVIGRHRGRVWGVSTIGESATFYFTLPVTVRFPVTPNHQ